MSEKKYLIITGASQGIGKKTAHYFLMQGWVVINISRRNCDLSQVENFNLDLLDKNLEQKAREYFSDFFDKPEKICLVHNAFSYHKDNVYTVEFQRLREMFEVSIVSAITLNQILLPHMSAGSSIIYIGSTLSEKAVPDAASYTICKHATIGLMKSTCQDLINPDIHTCCICPGFTETDMFKAHKGQDIELVNQIKSRVKANRLIQPEEIAELIYFCAHHSVINGSVVHANLGQVEN